MGRILYLVIAIALFTGLYAQPPKLNMVRVANGFTNPVDIKNCGDDRMFIVEQPGYILIMDKHGNKNPTPFLDIHTKALVSSEQGLLSVAFGPTFKQDGYFYVNYTAGTGSGVTRIARFKVSDADSNYADPATEKILLTFSQPYTNHKGATLMFDTAGYLYDTQGDGGNGGDPQQYAQNVTVFLGKMLRLDVSNHDTTYLIPPTNPFNNTRPGAKKEIWSFGLRNPWRCSFDRLTHDMWIGDVGQNLYEEIDFEPAGTPGGRNYGWRCFEGFHTYAAGNCDTTPPTPPILEYGHGPDCSVIGGYVYRGAQFEKLWGRYMFTDYCSGRFWSIKKTGPNTFDPDTFPTFLANQYSTFGEDNKGELYVAARNEGAIYHVTDTSTCKPVAFITFSDTLAACNPVVLNALTGDSLTYQWYNSNGPVPNAIDNNFAAVQSGWYKVKVSKAAAGCETFSDSVFANVFDSIILTIPDNVVPICINQPPVVLNTIVSSAGGIFTGKGIIDSIFEPMVAGLGESAIAYHTSTINGCKSDGNFLVEVKDTAILVPPTVTPRTCNNGFVINLAEGITPVGGVYSGTGVINNSIFNPALSDTGLIPITYRYSNNGCTSTALLNILVKDTVQLTEAVTKTSFCTSVEPFSLDQFILPIGGTYYGVAVRNDTFYPIIAGVGIHTLSYFYTDSNQCTSVRAFTITVTICDDIPVGEENALFTVFPNPTNGLFDVQAPKAISGPIQLIIYDLSGRTYSNRLTENPSGDILHMNAEQLPKGIYIFRIKSREFTGIKRLVIN